MGGCERSHGTPGSQIEGRIPGEHLCGEGGGTSEENLAAEDRGVVGGNGGNGFSLALRFGTLPAVLTRFNTGYALAKIGFSRNWN